MFILTKLKSLVKIEPRDLCRSLPEALSDNLNSKLSNKVVKDVGLIISLYDILEIGDSHIFPGDGSSHTMVVFRLLVFRPFIEEILIGRIKSSTKEGVYISVGFFDDIFVPPEALQHPAKFEENDQVWVWDYPTDEGSHTLYMDPGEEIRFRVTSEIFVDCSPNLAPESVSSALDASVTSQEDSSELEEKKIPYQLKASINEQGLGLLSWWNN